MDWAKFIVAGSLCVVILAIVWAGKGIGGKIAVGIIVYFIILNSILKVWNKLLSEKIKRCHEKIRTDRMISKIDRLDENLGEMAIRFQRYLDESKKGDAE